MKQQIPALPKCGPGLPQRRQPLYASNATRLSLGCQASAFNKRTTKPKWNLQDVFTIVICSTRMAKLIIPVILANHD